MREIIPVLTIKFIDIMEKDIYIEYSNGDFKYTSFTNAKKIIKKVQPKVIHFLCVDKEKSNNFLNLLLNKYKLSNSSLILK